MSAEAPLADPNRIPLSHFFGARPNWLPPRQDEAGTPWCVTVDGETSEEQTVTIRDRDTLEQVRVSVDQVEGWVRERLG